MSYYYKNLRAQYDTEDNSDENEYMKMAIQKDKQSQEDSSEDEMQSISFGALKRAEAQLEGEDRGNNARKRTSRNKRDAKYLNSTDERPNVNSRKEQPQPKMFTEESFDESSSDSSSGSEGLFEEEEEEAHAKSRRSKESKSRKKRKHAPREVSSKKAVSQVRRIPGLETPKNMNSNLYQDIRFDKSLGKSESYEEIRKRYKFLDEYRQREIEEMSGMLKDRKFLSKIGDRERDEMEQNLRSAKSRLQSLQNRDLERQIVKDYEGKINEGNKGKYHLKDSEKRKVIQKWKFDHMKAKQREKVMERKRKKRLGKEFKQFEFHSR